MGCVTLYRRGVRTLRIPPSKSLTQETACARLPFYRYYGQLEAIRIVGALLLVSPEFCELIGMRRLSTIRREDDKWS